MDDKGKLKRRNVLLGSAVMGVSAAMLAFAFAMVPLFKIICAKLGLDGTTQRAYAAPAEVTSVPMTVRFDANIDRELPWKFEPIEKSVQLKLGESKTVRYLATNISDRPTTGTATFNVTPEKTGQYFNKLECFCFQEQTLQPGESVEMAVTFFVDPALVKDHLTDEVRTITLSYTFYRSINGLPSNAGGNASSDAIKLSAAPATGAASVN
jgi:cytochrome c oxidase assembly protein subunit 11